MVKDFIRRNMPFLRVMNTRNSSDYPLSYGWQVNRTTGCFTKEAAHSILQMFLGDWDNE